MPDRQIGWLSRDKWGRDDACNQFEKFRIPQLHDRMIVFEFKYSMVKRMEITHDMSCIVGKLYRINQVTKILENQVPR